MTQLSQQKPKEPTTTPKSITSREGTASSAIPAAFEMFEPGTCDQVLPVNAVRQVIRFGRLVQLIYNGAITSDRVRLTGVSKSLPVILPRQLLHPALVEAAAHSPSITGLKLQGGVSPVEGLGIPVDELELPLVRTISLEKVEDLSKGELKFLKSRPGIEEELRESGEVMVRLERPGTAPFIRLAIQPAAATSSDAPVSSGTADNRLRQQLQAAAGMQTGQQGASNFPYKLAIYLPFEQTWTLLGYSRGMLVNTVTLAPQEELSIEVFSWDRTTTSTEDTSSFEGEQSFENTSTSRDTSDTLHEMTRSSKYSLEMSLEASVKIVPFTSSFNLGTGFEEATNDAVKETVTELREATEKASSRVKISRTSKVTTTREFGSERRTTRRLRNPNQCHTLNIDMWEVLSTYRVETKPSKEGVRLCVLLPNPVFREIPTFTRHTLRQHASVLKRVLLERELEPGFEAARLLAARDRACDILCETCACETTTQIEDISRSLGSLVVNVVQTFRTLQGATLEQYSDELVIGPIPQQPSSEAKTKLSRWCFARALEIKQMAFFQALEKLVEDTYYAQVITEVEKNVELSALIPKGAASPSAKLQWIQRQLVSQTVIDPANGARLRGMLNQIQAATQPALTDEAVAALLAAFALFDPAALTATALESDQSLKSRLKDEIYK